MPKGYHHVTYEQRCRIYALKQRGDSVDYIVYKIRVDQSTIYRELQRNPFQGRYIHIAAQIRSENRRLKASSIKKKMTSEIGPAIENRLRFQWSPVQISGRLKENGLFTGHESIYRHIWKDQQNRGRLYKNLRHQGKKYNKRGSVKTGRGYILNRIDSDERPEIVDMKTRIGDFECDTIIGRNYKGVLVSIVAGASKYTID